MMLNAWDDLFIETRHVAAVYTAGNRIVVLMVDGTKFYTPLDSPQRAIGFVLRLKTAIDTCNNQT
jgi:hypothetical protein